MRFFITLSLVVLAGCSTASYRPVAAVGVAQGFAQFYVRFIPPAVEVVHVVAETPDAATIAPALRFASRTFLVKIDGKYVDTNTGMVDSASQKRCIVLRLSMKFLSPKEAEVSVACIDRSWTLMTYILRLESSGWMVADSKFIGAS